MENYSSIKKRKVLVEIIKIFYIFVGILMMGFAFNSFFCANNIAPGGFGGIAAVISDFFSVKLNWFYISPTILYLLMNVILIFFALKSLGKKYFFYSLMGIGLYSLCIEFLKINIALNDMFLASLFGAVLMGIGTGLVVRGGGSTGGGEMLGNILHYYNNEITVGKIIIVVDCFVLILSFATYGIVNSLYTLLAIYISGKITDLVLEGGKGTKAYYIISDKYEEISNVILTKLYRGATLIDGTGVYSKTNKNILLCLLNKYEARNLKDIVFEIDEHAFLFSTTVAEAYGKGFDKKVRYKKAKKELTINEENLKDVNKEIINNCETSKNENTININNNN